MTLQVGRQADAADLLTGENIRIDQTLELAPGSMKILKLQ